MMTGEANGTKPVLVLGVGNLIQCDDGAGVHAIETLMKEDWPDVVELFDGGTAGYDLLPVFAGRRAVIVIDAVDADQPAGTLFRFTPDDVDPDFTGYDSIHQLGLIETLHMASLQGNAPERTVILGVQPGVIDWGMELSDPVAKALDRVLELAREEIQAALEFVNATIEKA